MAVTDILITHPHIDHIKDLCFLIENSFHPDRQELRIHSTAEIINDIHTHLFNNVLWPDFTKIPIDSKSGRFLMKFCPIEGSVSIDGVKIEPIKVNHPGNAVGYLLDAGNEQIVFSGDTGPTEKLWQKASDCANLRAIFTEISFPSNMEALAKAAGHFTTRQLLDELAKVRQKDIPVYIAHFKPQFLEELMNEFHRMAPERVILMHQEDEYIFE